ncbi:MAG: polyribonucleotide nucleotidyltransferase [Actinobacteria bacterium]|nr:polyribonucleotide nucleotidyltransferase [Actinomycetota bacterium]
MADAISVSGAITGTDKTLTFETGKLAPQSQGAVVGRIGDTTVLVTANAAKGIREGIDFFPLTVDVEERMYAAGKIPGSFFRREGRPTESAILTCRLIDRPLRPSFAEGYRNETQIVVTVLGADQENPHDVLAINAASAALMVSGIPFSGPLGAVRVAYGLDGAWHPHPTYQDGDASTFELVVAGRRDGDDIAIMMVEAGGTEGAARFYDDGAPLVTEEVIGQGLEQAKEWIRQSIELQDELVAAAGTREPLAYEAQHDYGDDVLELVAKVGSERLGAVQTIAAKAERNAAAEEATRAILAEVGAVLDGREREVKAAVKALTKKLIRQRVTREGVRIDGRGTRDLRPLSAEVGLLPTAHGSALFERGETQVLNILTLGMPRMDQLLDTVGIDERKRYMHHYNMPPYANGETGRVGSPKRREIGHGLLAERALLPVVPSKDDWPYALRLVSEVLSSNGSTSMASVCASSLSLMDAGVPVSAAVAGIAMGLIFDDDTYTTLTDILGAEDAYGDMDFKVAGTADYVTALQLDTKIEGLPAEVLAGALQQAKEARLHILQVMDAAIAAPRSDVAPSAPKIVSFQIPIDKIGEVIGPKGKVINAMQQETGADIAVDDDGMIGTVTIGSKDGEAVTEARRRIELLLDPPAAEVGVVYPGRVVNITKFGAFVNILPGRDGLVHISKLGGGRRIDRVEDVLSLGDPIEVRVDDIDPQGKVSLSPIGAEGEDGGDDSDGGGRPPRGSSGGDGGGGSSRAQAERGERGERDRNRRPDRGERGRRPEAERPEAERRRPATAPTGVATASFEDAFDAEVRDEFGDLGPDPSTGRPAERRGGGGGGGGGGGDRRPRRRSGGPRG